MKIFLYKNDLPDNLELGDVIAIDTEAMGLNNIRDRLCLIQISSGDGNVHLVKFDDRNYNAPNLVKVLEHPDILKIMHFARFDVSIICKYLGVVTHPVYCTKIASKIARTYTDKHGLKELCKELLGVHLNKEQQSTDWGAKELSREQMEYAANDVLYLHKLRTKLNEMLSREDRDDIAEQCFNFIPSRALLDLYGWEDDIFAH